MEAAAPSGGDAPDASQSRCSARVSRNEEGALVLTLDYGPGTAPEEKAWAALKAIGFTNAALSGLGDPIVEFKLDDVRWTGEDADAKPWWDLAVKAFRLGLDAAPSESPWRPIDEAPKDGTEVLGHWEGQVFICSWVAERERWFDDYGSPMVVTDFAPLPSPPEVKP